MVQAKNSPSSMETASADIQKRPVWRVFAAACIVAAGFGAVITLYAATLTNKNASERDFISYWAAGRQLVQSVNPYDFGAIHRLEVAAGRLESEKTLMMRNLPLAIPYSWPLGFFEPKTALILWLIVLLCGMALSVWLIWILQGRPNNRLHLFGLLFPPAIACLPTGQIGIFLLLGVALFLLFHKSRPAIAGAALLFCALKPHLFVPFGLVLIAWCITRRTYRILAGFLAAFVLDCGLIYLLDPGAWSQYSSMMDAGGALGEKIPELSAYFRFFISERAVWLQFLPQAIAVIWALWYFWKNRARWSWTDQGLIVLLVSAMCTPFGWLTDEAVLLPAVLLGLYRASEAHRSILPIAVLAGTALIEVQAKVQLTSPYYLWTTPAWLAWYLYATGRFSARESQAQKELVARSS